MFLLFPCGSLNDSSVQSCKLSWVCVFQSHALLATWLNGNTLATSNTSCMMTVVNEERWMVRVRGKTRQWAFGFGSVFVPESSQTWFFFWCFCHLPNNRCITRTNPYFILVVQKNMRRPVICPVEMYKHFMYMKLLQFLLDVVWRWRYAF